MTTLSQSNPRRAEPARRAVVACTHCGLAVPPGMIEASAETQFCCAGCRAVYGVITACGLDAFYRLVAGGEGSLAPARPTGKTYETFDNPTFAELYCRTTSAGTCVTRLYLEGVHCAACVWLIEKLPALVPGVVSARLDYRRQIAEIAWDEQVVHLSTIARRLDRLGYPPHPHRTRHADDERRAEDRGWLVRLGVAGALAGNVMLLAFALYGGRFHGIDASLRALFQGTSLMLSAIALAGPGRIFFRGAVGALRARVMHMDVPVALGLSVGMAWSVANTVRGAGEVYFDSITLLVFLLLVGRWVQRRRQHASAEAVELLFSMTPRTTRLVRGGEEVEVPVEALQAGDIVAVRVGEDVPVDGVVLTGATTIDTATLTGETHPQPAGPGASVFAGTTNVAAPITIEVETTGEATRIGRLMHLVEECAQRPAPIVRLADRTAAWFVAVIIVLALATVVVWWPIDPARAVPNAVALLIVTCPCALGLATPLAVVAGIGQAARRGMLVKGGAILERLNRPGTILFDKTGTLTHGHTEVAAWHGPEPAKGLVASLVAGSSHHVARALAACAESGVDGARVDAVETKGRGMRGTVGAVEVAVGERSFVEDADAGVVSGAVARAGAGFVARGLSPVFVAVEGRVVAVAGLGDVVRADARAALSRLRGLGWRVGILSGDHPAVVARVGASLGLSPEASEGGVTPERKLARVEETARCATVVMVGDGVNDAAALAAASVGVAVRGGAEASLAAADVYLEADGVLPVVDLLVGARRTVRVIRLNLAVSLVYNLIGATLAMTGLIGPLGAAILMPLSSLSVIGISARSRMFRGARCR